jgi:predicted DNA-binding protein with PD1-like motif
VKIQPVFVSDFPSQCSYFFNTFISPMKLFALRFQPGSDLKRSLLDYANAHQLQAAAIVTCVGSLKKASIRMADKKQTTVLEEKMEIVSLVGTFSVSGAHIHISLSDGTGKTIGGHLQEDSLVHTTAEIVIVELEDHVFTREADEQTGYKELVIKKI